MSLQLEHPPPIDQEGRPGTPVRISHAGVGSLLLDPARDTFDMAVQAKLLALEDRLRSAKLRALGIQQVILGMNNLLVTFDPSILHPLRARDTLAALWASTEAKVIKGKSVVFDVIYGGEQGEDLPDVADTLGLSIADVVRMHCEAEYTVASIGSMPGFPYIAGLPASLHIRRRSVPRLNLASGSVIIGGAQASVLPMAGPCGWHVLGATTTKLFDLAAERASLLAPGDQVRFNAIKVMS
ncbi:MULTISPECIES: 5-oxoprolinase subunit PxpB [unclassified Cupriavidus]|uniref:5-oxoprolinase subunit PxpB n=1 Tax=unclassified Cupriavidus TaxID=2640874 RepID=UPI001BFFE597|nr:MULTISPECIES: 5-oxoprolinase subunit PxpB [unclassified Cupriavidus]MCA3187689.1 5-oxoprolinase subunit PxpB [Cupriavidus sp.]MCA3189120.1 5-oxoprolinase subunit PxpB [Cupriavidus sp.]MCA3198840.1 5-oxoprolinase subunit PxpB [Cupriavidus sp.]MCA3201584.1 5-oxoprolinase subunit PxpB [Cupriavidus sp.]MCA3230875.1 5-oxoprolinase subunit PxpB [Cupriavidus sp.]